MQSKETISKTKRQPIEEEKIFANDVTDQGLTSEIYKYLIEFSIKKTNDSVKNMGRAEQTFLQRRHTDGQQAHEKMPDFITP